LVYTEAERRLRAKIERKGQTLGGEEEEEVGKRGRGERASESEREKN